MRLTSADGRWWWNGRAACMRSTIARSFARFVITPATWGTSDGRSCRRTSTVADGRGVDWVRERAVVVINRVVKDTQVDVGGMEVYFRQWVRACLRISQDPHLKTGGVFDWGQISRAADEEIRALTAEIARGFSLGRAIPGDAVPK